MKLKLIITITVVILCLVFGGIGIAKYTNTSHIKEGLTLGNKYLQEGKYEEAILAFKKVIQVDPKNIEARVGLAKVYIKTGKQNEAEKVLKEAISIDPKKTEPYLELAKLYTSENNPVNAIKILADGYKATNDESMKTTLEDRKSKIIVDNISKTLTLGENYSLPKEVNAKINNVEVKFSVKWDKTIVDATKIGTQTFNGILENADKVVKLTLNIITIASIENINSTINQNDKYSLPSKVTAKMTDGSARDVEVTWSPQSIDTSKARTYSYEGTVSRYNSKVRLTLNVENDKKNKILNLQKSIVGKWVNDFGETEVITESTIGGNPYKVIFNESSPEENKLMLQFGNDIDSTFIIRLVNNNEIAEWHYNPVAKGYFFNGTLKRVN